MAEEVFERPPSAELMSAVITQLEAQGFVHDRQELLRRPERLVWRHNIKCQFGTNRLQITGEGLSPDKAYAAAFMGFMYQLHVFGWLKQIFEQQDVQQVVQEQRRTFAWTPAVIAAKTHIHNFAARYLCTPWITNHKLRDGTFKATVVLGFTPGEDDEISGHHEEFKYGRPQYLACATAAEPRIAEFLAHAELKRQIERKLAREDHTINLQDRTYINIDNVQSIIRFYSLSQKYGHLRFVDEQVPGPDGESWSSAQAFWENRALSTMHEMPTRREARTLAELDTAVKEVRKRPALLEEYRQATEKFGGRVPWRLPPTFASLSPDVVETLNECVEVAQDTELATFELKRHTPGYKPNVGQKRDLEAPPVEDRYYNTVQSLAARSDELKQQQERDGQNTTVMNAMTARTLLPIYQHKAQILAMVKNHMQCIVVGSTGSGKSTQVPQLILDDAIAEGRGALCNIICTQPRRISSVALALTVCKERDRDLGDMVGYRIGGDYHNSSKKGGSITYCTTELLANELERAEEELPHNVSHIIVDEVHERSPNLERLLSVIKMSFSKRLDAGLRVPKLVMMSATVESSLFEQYFEMISQDGTLVRPPYLNVPGRTFKTETKFLEDFDSTLPPEIYQAIERLDQQDQSFTRDSTSMPPAIEPAKKVVQWESERETSRRGLVTRDKMNLMVATIVQILRTTEHGALLAFLPGASEIRLVHQALLDQKQVDISNARFEVLMLHRANPSHLVRALDTTPEGVRRIMLSTNIAESSITFPDVEFVVDSGLQRSDMDMSTHLQILRDDRISRANVVQRAGRAGRTKPGQYYGTFTSEEMQSLDAFPVAQDASLNRVESIYLRGKIHFPNVPVQQVFDSYLTPIPAAKVQVAEKHLRELGALTESGDVSMIGYSLYRTTVDPALARMVLLGIVFRCLDRAIIIATLLSTKFTIFKEVSFDDAQATDRRAPAQRFSDGSKSDIIAQMRAYEAYKDYQAQDAAGAPEWAATQGIDHFYCEQMQARADAIRRVMSRAGFFNKTYAQVELNAASDNLTLLKMVVCAGLYPNVANHLKKAVFVTHQAFLVLPSPNSVSFTGSYNKPEELPTLYEDLKNTMFCYRRLFASKSGSHKYYMGDISPVTPLMLALFSPNVKMSPDKHNLLMVDDSVPLQFSGDAKAAHSFLEFKKIWDAALLDRMQQISEIWSVEKDKRTLYKHSFTDIILGAVQELLDYEEGQAMKREEDVGTFVLGNEKSETNDPTTTITPGTGLGGRYRPLREAPEDMDISGIVCSICGREGHTYDDCPRNRTTESRGSGYLRNTQQETPAPWEPSFTEDAEAPAVWSPGFNEDDHDHGLSELPSEIKYR